MLDPSTGIIDAGCSSEVAQRPAWAVWLHFITQSRVKHSLGPRRLPMCRDASGSDGAFHPTPLQMNLCRLLSARPSVKAKGGAPWAVCRSHLTLQTLVFSNMPQFSVPCCLKPSLRHAFEVGSLDPRKVQVQIMMNQPSQVPPTHPEPSVQQ